MATAVIMPRQGQSVESCIIGKWHKKVGDAVAVGDTLFTYETDKATFDEEATVAGTLLAVFFEEGDDVECLTNVCVIGNAGEDASAFAPGGAAPAPEAAPAAAPAPAPVAAPAADRGPEPTNAKAVIMPRQGQSVESCIIGKWHKKVGDTVAIGDALFTYETDKATFDEEATVEGTMLAIFFEEGDDVECLTNVCVIGEPGANAAYFAPGADAPQAAPAAVAAPVAAAPVAAPVATATASTEGFVAISPRARNLAERAHVDFHFATPTGPKGRIMERDIEALIANGGGATAAAAGMADSQSGTGIGGRFCTADIGTAAPAAESAPAAAEAPKGDTWEEKLPNIRKVIARNMHKSLSEMAQLTLNTSFDATQIMAYRSMVKNKGQDLGLENITLNDIVLYAVARILPNHPDLNAHFLGDTMKYFRHVQLGIAVDTPKGLMVPTLRDADTKSLNQIAKESKELAKAAQSGTISPDLLTGGSFTVTNLGAFGIESFTPVINPPQTAILGVDTITQKVREVNGEIKLYPSMGLSLTFDHRAVDGAPAARLLKELGSALENFSILLAK